LIVKEVSDSDHIALDIRGDMRSSKFIGMHPLTIKGSVPILVSLNQSKSNLTKHFRVVKNL